MRNKSNQTKDVLDQRRGLRHHHLLSSQHIRRRRSASTNSQLVEATLQTKERLPCSFWSSAPHDE